MALNGVAWPVGNPKTLRVSFSAEEQMTKYKEVSSYILLLIQTMNNEICQFRILMES